MATNRAPSNSARIRSRTRCLIVAAVVLGAAALTPPAADAAQSPGEPGADDRLPRSERDLIDELVARGMPELLEELLAHQPRMHRAAIARALVRAGLESVDAVRKEALFNAAADEYRGLLKLQDDGRWFRGELRRLSVAQWQVEFADLILRYWITDDLDRLEVTSGLDVNRPRLDARLGEARALYDGAGAILDELRVGLQTEEEQFFLLGIANRITELSDQRTLNASWASVYSAMVIEPDASDRKNLLAAALRGFDAVAEGTNDAALKYNAILGAGLALRESGQYAEADAAFDRVQNSTAPLALTVRARYEKARSHLAAGHFNAARSELDRLAAVSDRRLRDAEAGASFYVSLAPLIRAYSYVLEARTGDRPASEAAALEKKAHAGFAAMAERGGPWPEIVRVYVDDMLGARREPGEMSAALLSDEARRMMADRRYDRAVELLKSLLGRMDDDSALLRDEARFNLGVCRFQLGQRREAAADFDAVTRSNASEEVVRKAAEYAYRSWQHLAAASRTVDDYRRLAESAGRLADRFPRHELADEARWVAAVAREDAGRYPEAIEAYENVPTSSANYWPARQRAARCAELAYQALPDSAAPATRRTAARKAAERWQRLADDAAAADPASFGEKSKRDELVLSARINAVDLLSGDNVRAFEECLRILADLPSSTAVLRLRIRAHRGLGRLDEARTVLGDFLKQAPADDAGRVLLELAAEMEAEVNRLQETGRGRDAVKMANDAVDTVRQLLDWVETQPQHRRHAPVVRFSLVSILTLAGHRDEALGQLEQLMADAPDNGSYIRAAALIHEDTAIKGRVPEREAAARTAESLWARLLSDPGLRDRAPSHYWEARYYWLRHKLRQGHAAEVLKAIRTERAWIPDLGGPPWQGRLLELAEQAQARAPEPTP